MTLPDGQQHDSKKLPAVDDRSSLDAAGLLLPMAVDRSTLVAASLLLPMAVDCSTLVAAGLPLPMAVDRSTASPTGSGWRGAVAEDVRPNSSFDPHKHSRCS